MTYTLKDFKDGCRKVYACGLIKNYRDEYEIFYPNFGEVVPHYDSHTRCYDPRKTEFLFYDQKREVSVYISAKFLAFGDTADEAMSTLPTTVATLFEREDAEYARAKRTYDSIKAIADNLKVGEK